MGGRVSKPALEDKERAGAPFKPPTDPPAGGPARLPPISGGVPSRGGAERAEAASNAPLIPPAGGPARRPPIIGGVPSRGGAERAGAPSDLPLIQPAGAPAEPLILRAGGGAEISNATGGADRAGGPSDLPLIQSSSPREHLLSRGSCSRKEALRSPTRRGGR